MSTSMRIGIRFASLAIFFGSYCCAMRDSNVVVAGFIAEYACNVGESGDDVIVKDAKRALTAKKSIVVVSDRIDAKLVSRDYKGLLRHEVSHVAGIYLPTTKESQSYVKFLITSIDAHKKKKNGLKFTIEDVLEVVAQSLKRPVMYLDGHGSEHNLLCGTKDQAIFDLLSSLRLKAQCVILSSCYASRLSRIEKFGQLALSFPLILTNIGNCVTMAPGDLTGDDYNKFFQGMAEIEYFTPKSSPLLYKALDNILAFSENSKNFCQVLWPYETMPALLCNKQNGLSPVKKIEQRKVVAQTIVNTIVNVSKDQKIVIGIPDEQCTIHELSIDADKENLPHRFSPVHDHKQNLTIKKFYLNRSLPSKAKKRLIFGEVGKEVIENVNVCIEEKGVTIKYDDGDNKVMLYHKKS